MSSLRSTEELQQTLMDAFPLSTSDPLDSRDFDAVDYVNQHIPSEVSLVDIEPFGLRITSQISAIDDEISKAIQIQSVAGTKATHDLADTKDAIRNLHAEIGHIREKAMESERLVQEICSDIRRLDNAKKNLQTTITTLKRLQMLITAIQQLEVVVDMKMYDQAAHLLEAVNQLTKYFEKYRNVPRVRDLCSSVDTVKIRLKAVVTLHFDQIGFQLATATTVSALMSDAIPDASQMDPNLLSSVSAVTSGNSSKPGVRNPSLDATQAMHASIAASLSAAQSGQEDTGQICLVLEALGMEYIEEILNRFIGGQLMEPYRSLFKKGSPAASFDKIDRRFVWFKKLLHELEVRFPLTTRIIPAHWKLQQRICIAFSDITCKMLGDALHDPSNNESQNVTLLLKSLGNCVAFEREMSAKFELNNAPNSRSRSSTKEVMLDDEGNVVDSSSTQAIRMKYTRIRDETSKEGDEIRAMDALNRQRALKGLPPLSIRPGSAGAIAKTSAFKPIRGIMTSVFDSCMGPYIEQERSKMGRVLSEVMNIEDIDREGELPVLRSSIRIFMAIKTSANDCLMLSSGELFFNMHKEYKAYLQQYAQKLRQRLPPRLTSASGNKIQPNKIGFPGASNVPVAELPAVILGGVEVHHCFSPSDLLPTCYVINTSDYCEKTVRALQGMVKAKIDQQFKEDIDFTNLGDEFNDALGASLRALLGCGIHLVSPALRAMSSTDFSLPPPTSVGGEQHLYARDIVRVLNEIVQNVQPVLPPDYFTSFCGKYAASLLQAYRDQILSLRLRPPSDMAVQQMIVDFHDIKKTITDLPVLMIPQAERAGKHPLSYSRIIQSGISRIDGILTLLQTEPNMLVETFKLLLVDGSTRDLQSIMMVQGLKRSDQQALLEAYGMQQQGVQDADDDDGLKEKLQSTGQAISASMSDARQAGGELAAELAGKVRDTGRTFLGAMKNFGDDFKKTIGKRDSNV